MAKGSAKSDLQHWAPHQRNTCTLISLRFSSPCAKWKLKENQLSQSCYGSKWIRIIEAHKYCIDNLHRRSQERINKGYLQSRLGLICEANVSQSHTLESPEESKIKSHLRAQHCVCWALREERALWERTVCAPAAGAQRTGHNTHTHLAKWLLLPQPTFWLFTLWWCLTFHSR